MDVKLLRAGKIYLETVDRRDDRLLGKILFVVLDGVGDRPIPELNYTTTLECAMTPNLDFFARRSVAGLVYSVGKGIAPESDVAVYSLLGYKVSEEYVGRGVVEALGCGLNFRDGDLALRGNFATVKGDFTIVDRRVGRSLSSEEASLLSETINRHVKFGDPRQSVVVKSTIGHRCVVVFKVDGFALSDKISNTDPAYAKVHGMGVVASMKGDLKVARCEPTDGTREARVSSELVNEFTEKAFKILDGNELNAKRREKGMLPANMILLRDAGSSLPRFRSLQELYGLKAAILADMPVEIGIARTVGADVFTEGSPTDFESKARKALMLLRNYGLVYVHLKGPDEPGHDGDYLRKKKSIEAIDSQFFGVLKAGLNLEDIVLMVASDHATPCILKGHSDDPVPLIIASAKLKRDHVCRYTEMECSAGSLGVVEGYRLLDIARSISMR
ncbi:MAG: alkaline phosphatase family protein [Nitrososphaeria archaeon]